MQGNLVPKVGGDQAISQGKDMIIAACNVSLTSLETQSPTEEGTRNYKMEIEGESLQSRCQEALPAWETAMTSLQGCLGSHT